MAGATRRPGRRLEAHRCAATPAEIPGHRAPRRRTRTCGAAYVHSLVLLRCADCRSAQGAQPEFEDRHDRGQGRGRAGRDAEGVERHRFRRPQRVRFHHQGRGGGPRFRPHRGTVLAQRRRSRRAQRGPRRPREHGRAALRHAGLQARPGDRELFHRLPEASLYFVLQRPRLQIALHLLPLAADDRRPPLSYPQRRARDRRAGLGAEGVSASKGILLRR